MNLDNHRLKICDWLRNVRSDVLAAGPTTSPSRVVTRPRLDAVGMVANHHRATAID
jgi:hypothetical protein